MCTLTPFSPGACPGAYVVSSVGPMLPKSGNESRLLTKAMTAPAIGTTTETSTTAAMMPPIARPDLPTAVAMSAAWWDTGP